MTVGGLTISSAGPNTDGRDPESCDGVVVQNVTYDAGDDCMAIKAGRDADGRRVNVPCQNVVIQHCTFANGHGGITLADWTVDTCKGIWSIVGASASDPIGTVTLHTLTITTSTAANSAEFISNLVVKDVTVGGAPVTA